MTLRAERVEEHRLTAYGTTLGSQSAGNFTVMIRPSLLLLCALGLAPLPGRAAETITSPPSSPNAPRFELERDWSGELRPRYKGPQPEEAISAPIITPESPRAARKADPAPKIEVWDEAEAHPRENRYRENDRRRARADDERAWRDRAWAARNRAEREWEAREARAWRERQRAERAWREQERMEHEMARRDRHDRRAEFFDCDFDDPRDRC